MPDTKRLPDTQYLTLLAKEFPNIRKASMEIVNLTAILSLPKGTEYFLSDLHGEHEAFVHMVKSASGVIFSKIEEIFSKSLPASDRRSLAALVYNAKAEMARRKKTEESFDDWCRTSIYRLTEICKSVSTKYTRSKVRKRMPDSSRYIMDELVNADNEINRSRYYGEIVNSIIDNNIAEQLIEEMTETIYRLAVDRLHIIGDVFDRGAHPERIMDYLMDFHDVDFQWGNHDILWMGAASGDRACIANVIRINVSYNNFDMLEIGYGVNLRVLSSFALDVYRDDPCEFFRPHVYDVSVFDPVEPELAAKMHKAIAIIQFKLEGQRISKNPEYDMDERLLLDKLDIDAGTVKLRDGVYPLRDCRFPTVDPANPYELTPAEEELIRSLEVSFRNSEKLQRHIRYLFSHGSLYKAANGNLLYHGCIPMSDAGEFETFMLSGERPPTVRAYLDLLDAKLRRAYFDPETPEDSGLMWLLWCHRLSPLFGKDRMTTFERCFVEDKKTHKELANAYYTFIQERAICERILCEFGLDPARSRILNGHVPVKIKNGENPVKGGGLLFFIDGGIAKSYQKSTGIAGYTFIFNSRFMALSEHKPYSPLSEDGSQDFAQPTIRVVETLQDRMTVKDTDIGATLEQSIVELKELINAFRKGTIKEKL